MCTVNSNFSTLNAVDQNQNFKLPLIIPSFSLWLGIKQFSHELPSQDIRSELSLVRIKYTLRISPLSIRDCKGNDIRGYIYGGAHARSLDRNLGISLIISLKSTLNMSVPFTYHAKAQSTFKPPLIANENAFLGDIQTRYAHSKIPLIELTLILL
jgi:hypothetical protein